MKARDDAYEEGKVHGRREEREGWVSTPQIRTTNHAATHAAPTTAKRRCAALHTEPPVDEFFTLLKSAETTAEPRTLPDFRPRAAARK
jgi:hypothetical protein